VLVVFVGCGKCGWRRERWDDRIGGDTTRRDRKEREVREKTQKRKKKKRGQIGWGDEQVTNRFVAVREERRAVCALCGCVFLDWWCASFYRFHTTTQQHIHTYIHTYQIAWH
jgi:hypothetical protein